MYYGRAERLQKEEYTYLFDALHALTLVVRHVTRRGAELCVRLDYFVDGFQKVLLRRNLTAGSDGEHAGFRAN